MIVFVEEARNEAMQIHYIYMYPVHTCMLCFLPYMGQLRGHLYV